MHGLMRATLDWIPHFTSIIGWVQRVGLARLHALEAIAERWIAIVDCSIDVGVRKALLVLRVKLDALARRGGAVNFQDVQCIGLKIAVNWNGQSVADALKDIFGKAGKPAAILKDQGTDLNKGVRLWREDNGKSATWILQDLGHVVANALKAEFAKRQAFEDFLKIVSTGASRLRQTILAILMPPKVRTKGRFQSISRLAGWAEKILRLMEGQGRACEHDPKTQLRRAFRGLSALRPFIEHFQQTCHVAAELMRLLKNEGLNQETYRQAKVLITCLPERSKVRHRVERWLDLHLRIQCRMAMGQEPLLVSSDVIESLFGKFKMTIQRSPAAELNRMALVLPALCGKLDGSDIQDALGAVSHDNLIDWSRENIPPTMKQLRRSALGT